MSGELEQMEEHKEKCFIMMPISDVDGYPAGHFSRVYEDIFKPAIEAAGYESIRVDENKICDSIVAKIFDYIQTCEMCLCDLSSRNPNVLYELGLRQAYDKPVVLVQDIKTEKIFDIGGISTVYYRSERLYDEVIEDREKIMDAIIATRDGATGYNSIIKVIKAKKAVIDTGEISDQEKIEIMLSAIQNDVKLLKKSNLKYDTNSSISDLKTEDENIEFINERLQKLVNNAIVEKDYKKMTELMTLIERLAMKAHREGDENLERKLCNERYRLRNQVN